MLAVCAIVGVRHPRAPGAESRSSTSACSTTGTSRSARSCIALVGLGFNSSMLLVALYAQKILACDAWNAGLVLAPGGLGTMISLMISGRLVARTDQRAHAHRRVPAERLRLDCMMTSVTLGDGLLEPRVAAIRPGVRDGLHLPAAPDAHARDDPHGAPRQRDRRLQRGPQRRRQHRRRAGHHAASCGAARRTRPRSSATSDVWDRGYRGAASSSGPITSSRQGADAYTAGAPGRSPCSTAPPSSRRRSWPTRTTSG